MVIGAQYKAEIVLIGRIDESDGLDGRTALISARFVEVEAGRMVASANDLGGPGSRVYKTTDGGDNWEMLTNGLPQGMLGQIGDLPDWITRSDRRRFARAYERAAGRRLPRLVVEAGAARTHRRQARRAARQVSVVEGA